MAVMVLEMDAVKVHEARWMAAVVEPVMGAVLVLVLVAELVLVPALQPPMCSSHDR